MPNGDAEPILERLFQNVLTDRSRQQSGQFRLRHDRPHRAPSATALWRQRSLNRLTFRTLKRQNWDGRRLLHCGRSGHRSYRGFSDRKLLQTVRLPLRWRLILPPYFRTRTTRNVAPARCEPLWPARPWPVPDA